MDRNFNNIEKSANEAIAAAEENARQIGVLKNIFVKKDDDEEEEESDGTKIRRNVSWGHLNEIVGVEKNEIMLQEGHNSTFGHDNNDQHNNYNNNNDNNKNDEAQVGLTFKNAARLVSGMMSLSTKPPPGTYTSDGTGIQNMEVLDSDPSDFSEASSLNDEDIVSDSDEFVDAITRHHSCKGDMLELIQQMSFSDEEDSSDDDSKESITHDVEENNNSDDDNDDDNDKVSDEHNSEEDKEISANEVEFVKPRKMEPNKTTSFRRGKSKRGFLPNFFQSGSSRRFNLGLRNQNNNNSSLDMKDAASSTGGGGGGDLDVDFPTRKRGGGSFRKNLNESFDEDSYVSSISSESSVSTVGFNESIFCDPELVTPLTFTSQEHNPILSYFDSHLWNIEITNSIQSDFLMEHSLFLRAAFQLLEERETFGVEANADDPNTIKTGPVKKKSSLRKGKVRIRWKIKYVEIRKGIFSYYEDTKASGGELHRKNIPLRSNLCTCRAVNNDPKPSLARNNGFMFELRNESGSTSLWMVNSAEERAAWIRSINEAMIGKQPVSPTNNNTNTKNTTAATSTSTTPTTPTTTTSTGGFGTSRLIPNLFVGNSSSSQYTGVYHEAYNEFDSIQKSVNRAKNKDAYLNSFFNLWGNSIKLPLQIFKEEGKSLSTVKKAMSPSTSQLWKLLGRGSYSINGHYLKGDVAYGPEKIIGALIRCILEYDRTEEDEEEKDEGTEEIREKNKQEEDNNKQNNNNKSRANNNLEEGFITEVQAVSYAREILTLCCLASKWGDLYSCVSELMLSPHNLVILLPYDSQTTPIDINVSYYNPNSNLDEIGRENARNNMEKSDWLTTRIKLIRGWKKMFCVLSEGVLSFYEKEYPIPHGLKGQLILVGATIGVSEISQGNTGEGGNDGDCDVRNNNEGANSNQQASTPTRVRYIISILSKDRSKERQLFFNDKDKFNAWNEALMDAIRHCSTLETPREQRGDEGQGGQEKKEDTKSWGTATKSSDTTRKNKSVADMFRSAVNKVGVVGGISNQTPNTSEPSEKLRDVFRSEIIDSKLKTTFGRSTGLPKQQQQQQQQQEKKEFNPADQTQNLQQQKPSVVITVEASTIYKICTSSPIGEELKDTWGMVRAKLTQSFYLSRGSNSRMYKGEEMLKMDFLKGYVQDTTFSMIFR